MFDFSPKNVTPLTDNFDPTLPTTTLKVEVPKLDLESASLLIPDIVTLKQEDAKSELTSQNSRNSTGKRVKKQPTTPSAYSISSLFKGSNTKVKRKDVPPYELPDHPVFEVVLPDFIEDTPELLSELFEYDFKWGRFQVLLEEMGTTSQDTHDFKEVLKKYYLPLKNIFLVLQSESADLKNIEGKQYADYCASIQLFNKQFKAEDLAKTYMEANTDDDSRLNRCEFIGAMIRCSIIKYKDTGKQETISASFEQLLREDILNRSNIAEGVYFRQKYMNEEMDQKLKDNEENL